MAFCSSVRRSGEEANRSLELLAACFRSVEDGLVHIDKLVVFGGSFSEQII